MGQSEVKEKISHLIEKFQRLTDSGKISSYNEARTRNEFIEPLFEALGWDMRNSQSENEVTTEETVSRDRVDLAFRINNIPIMFLEAKALKINLDEWKWAEQAINYSWNKGVTWAILTNFESIKVFNAELPPKSVSYNLFFELKWSEYLNKFSQLWLLSKDSFNSNTINQKASEWNRIITRKPVGEMLLESLMGWRRILSREFQSYNQTLPIDELDEGVQRLIDRLIFIRTTEDRHIESNLLLSIKHTWETNGRKTDLFKELNKIYRDFNQTYDSELFKFHRFENWETPPAETLAKIIQQLYETPDGYRYDFSAIDSDILGSIYEQYLGHVLQKAKKEARVEEKHKKRKNQGIFYTPKYIVSFIVKETVGKYIKEHNDHEIRNMTILDPACGSGSFLLEAYDELINHYKASTLEKIRILKGNIFGVDLDPQAVEITQLNLLLKTLSSKDIIPSLTDNICVGNSLISGNENTLKPYFGSKWQQQKSFKWEEGFGGVASREGFDVVVGNPPYVRVDSLDKLTKQFWNKNFSSATGKYDLYYLFIEKSIHLLKKNGLLGFIVPNKFCVASSAKELRKFIISNSKKIEIISVSRLPIFQDASNYPVIIILQKGTLGLKNLQISTVNKVENHVLKKSENFSLPLSDLKLLPDFLFPINANLASVDLVIRLITKFEKLGALSNISEGLRIPPKLEITSSENTSEIVKQYQLDGLAPIKAGSFISKENLEKIIKPNTNRYINIFREKILIKEDALAISATIDKENRIPQGGVYFLTVKNKKVSTMFVLALLNSRLMSFVYETLFSGMHMGGGYLRYRSEFLNNLPIVIPNDRSRNDVEQKIANLARLYFELSKISPNTDRWSQLKAEIKRCIDQINQAVYKLYGLTDKEIKIVEESVK